MKFKPKGWDELFEDEKNRWEKPNIYVPLLTKSLKKKFKNPCILDIGFGSGRHLVYFSKNGIKVSGFDIAKNSEKYARQTFSKNKIQKHIDLKVFDMHKTPWPYKSQSFEGALSINVVQHTNYKNFLKIVKEISRILIPGGLFLCETPSKANHKFGKGKRLDKYSYLTNFGAEKGIPHIFFDRKDLVSILKDDYKIKILKLIEGEIPEADKKMKKSKLDHWLILAEKK